MTGTNNNYSPQANYKPSSFISHLKLDPLTGTNDYYSLQANFTLHFSYDTLSWTHWLERTMIKVHKQIEHLQFNLMTGTDNYHSLQTNFIPSFYIEHHKLNPMTGTDNYHCLQPNFTPPLSYNTLSWTQWLEPTIITVHNKIVPLIFYVTP